MAQSQPASRTPYENFNQELMRQSRRIDEQTKQLISLLNRVAEDLNGIGNKFYQIDRAPELAGSLLDLEAAIRHYVKGAEPVFEKLSSELERYAKDSTSNAQELSSGVSKLSEEIENLF